MAQKTKEKERKLSVLSSQGADLARRASLRLPESTVDIKGDILEEE